MQMGVRKPIKDGTSGPDFDTENNSTSAPSLIEYLDDINKIPEPATKSPLRRRNKNTYKFPGNRDERRKSKGARQTRRNDNLKGLLCEQDTMSELDEMDYLCVNEPSFSAFAALFLEHEKMRIWNDFINHTEEDQTLILGGLKDLSLAEGEEGKESAGEADLLPTSTPDRRIRHPAFSGEECFMRIDHNLRTFLKKQHLPKGLLRKLEEELVGFFVEWPTSVYISQAENGFDRMMVHALSQYLDLVSRSYDGDDGSRRTQVENKNDDFQPPTTGLTEYLEYKH